MKFFWNLDLNLLTSGDRSDVARSTFEFKRRDGLPVEVVFVRNGIVQELPSTTEIRFALKVQNAWSGGNIAFSADFVEGDDHIWRANPNLNTTQMNDAFVDGSGEFASIVLMGELTMRADVGQPWQSTQTLTATVHNDVIRGEESTPNDADEPTDYLTAAQSHARFPRADAAQSFSSGEKAQLLANLGLTDSRVDVQVFSADGTWTKPANAVRVRRILVGGGGGGGSGANLSTAGGGGGGAPGLVVDFEGPASALSATEAVVVGAGGAGGAGVTSGNGNAGTAGGNTSFAGVFGRGGNAGAGGTASGGAGGSVGGRVNMIGGITQSAISPGADGGTGSTPAIDATASAGFMPTGGGGGGGVSGTTRIGGRAGGAGGNADIGLVAGGAGGAAGSTGVPGSPGSQGSVFPNGYGGGGGGGGAGSGAGSSNNGGAGGAGRAYGGGGGGGGAANGSGATTGAGGAGAAGVAIIITFVQA